MYKILYCFAKKSLQNNQFYCGSIEDIAPIQAEMEQTGEYNIDSDEFDTLEMLGWNWGTLTGNTKRDDEMYQLGELKGMTFGAW